MPQTLITATHPGEWLIFCGPVIHSVDDNPLLALERKILGVRDGKIKFLEDDSALERMQQKFGYKTNSVYHMKPGELLMPGFIDTHIHAPQYPNAGLGLDQPLLEWLNKYTYPTEAKFSEADMAKDAYDKVVRRTLANGTTTATYFATIHLEASLILCDILEEIGQRAYVGKVNIDCNAPDWYCESKEKSTELTEIFIKNILGRKNPLLTPIITPRFAICCSAPLMSSLGDLAQKYELPIQSHISESKDEVSLIRSKFPQSENYAHVYDNCNILTKKTIMAHGVHLEDEEIDLLKKRGVGIAHCPNSNISIKSGLCDVKKLMDKGLKVGLGTDVSGGYSPSMLDAMRQAIQTSNILSMDNPQYHPITYKEAFFLATRGGSQVLGLENKLGNFEEGKEFDALLIDINTENSPIDSFQNDTLEEKIQRFIYLGDDRNIKHVFVNGREVKSKKFVFSEK